MCGIVGYIGEGEAQEFLIEGLKRLEYRGYDSAGVATMGDVRVVEEGDDAVEGMHNEAAGEVTILKVRGKVADLERLVKENRRGDMIGIGHTRWATHGEPSEVNAHPHIVGRIVLVHNGIIENYRELKEKLEKGAFSGAKDGGGYVFKSETDTEVLAGLIDAFYADDLMEAVEQALQLVEGTYGIAVLATDRMGEMVVARKGSPLLIGVGERETLVASDAAALAGRTEKVIYLKDGEVARIRRVDDNENERIVIKNLKNEPVDAKIETIKADLAAVKKSGYEHFLLKEIMEQPAAVAETLRGRVGEDGVHLGGLNMSDEELGAVRHLIIVGCGSAYHAGLLASYYFDKMLPEVTSEVVVASEYRYRGASVPEGSLAVFVSQSGETADTLACVRLLKEKGVKTLGVVNVVGSTIAREVDGGIYIHAGPEISVASTKAFTAQVAGLLMLGMKMGVAAGPTAASLLGDFSGGSLAVPPVADNYLFRALVQLPEQMAEVLPGLVTAAKMLAEKYAGYEHAIYLGRAGAYPVALEGALKLKEVSYIDANAYPAGELKHGPLALVDEKFFVVAFLPKGELLAKSISNVQEVLARGGRVIAVTDVEDLGVEVASGVEGGSGLGDGLRLGVADVVKITTTNFADVDSPLAVEMASVAENETASSPLMPLIMNLFGQLFAYFIAVKRGVDVDQPRNLAKSVTVE